MILEIAQRLALFEYRYERRVLTKFHTSTGPCRSGPIRPANSRKSIREVLWHSGSDRFEIESLRRAFQDYVVNQAKERVHGLEAQLHQGELCRSNWINHVRADLVDTQTAEELRQAQERENRKLREQMEHQKAHLYKISDELKTVKDELHRVCTQKRQVSLKATGIASG